MNIPLISLPLDKRIVTLIPEARIVGDRLHVPHSAATSVLLKTIGITLPPAVSRYDYEGGKPFEIQKRTVELLTENPRAYVLNSMGTGKTKSAVWSFSFLRSQNLAKRMLVIAPLSTLKFVWAREVFATCPHLQVNVLHGGGRAGRLKLLAEPADIYVINPDGLGVVIDEVIRRKDIDVICIDELAMFRNLTLRTKLLKRIARSKVMVWGMTGAPMPNHPTDVYQQAMIVTPHTCPMSFTRFRDETMVKVGDFRWLPRPDATEKALKVLKPQVRFTLDDVAELPNYVTQYAEVPLSETQALVYKDIKQHCYGLIKGREVTTANAAVAMNKLLQISLGWVYGSDGSIIDLEGTPRLEALVDLVSASNHKVLVFVPYKHALSGVCAHLDGAKIENAMVSGDTPAKQRSEIFNLFQNTEKYKVLVAHPAVVAHGLTLTAATTVVWYGPVTSLEQYDQACARIRRVGQTHRQLFVHMHATPIEKYVYQLLIRKINAQDQLLQLLEEATKA
jgi:SNF2 family DNA or RNA helicase